MKIRIQKSTLEDLGNITSKIVGTKPTDRRFEINCIFDGKFDHTAFHLCLKKLHEHNVSSVQFVGLPIPPTAKIRKAVSRYLKTEDFTFEEEKKIQVEMTETEHKDFLSFKNRMTTGFGVVDNALSSGIDLSNGKDVVEKVTIGIDEEGKVQTALIKQPPANFKIYHDSDGKVIKQGSSWDYNKTLCDSPYEKGLIIREVGRRGVIFRQGMMFPRYDLEHFGEGKAFTRTKMK